MSLPYPIPSFQQGFARSAGESLFPNLRKGSAGLWAPFLGVQGQTLPDRSGLRNDGILTNMDNNNWVLGKDGWVLDYAEVSSNYVSIPNILVGNSSMTSFAWFRTTTSYTGATASRFVALGDVATATHRFVWGILNNIIWAAVRSGGGGSSSIIDVSNSSSPILNDGLWHFGVFVRDKSVGKIYFYLDGINISGGGITDRSGNIQNTTTELGRWRAVAGDFFTGQIGFAGIYQNRALLPQEIALLYAIPHAPLIPRDDLMAFLLGIADLIALEGFETPGRLGGFEVPGRTGGFETPGRPNYVI